MVNNPSKFIHGVLKSVFAWAALSEVLISLVCVWGTPSFGVFAKSLVCPKKVRTETIENLSLVSGTLARTTTGGHLVRRSDAVEETNGCGKTSHWIDLISRDSYSKCSKL